MSDCYHGIMSVGDSHFVAASTSGFPFLVFREEDFLIWSIDKSRFTYQRNSSGGMGECGVAINLMISLMISNRFGQASIQFWGCKCFAFFVSKD